MTQFFAAIPWKPRSEHRSSLDSTFCVCLALCYLLASSECSKCLVGSRHPKGRLALCGPAAGQRQGSGIGQRSTRPTRQAMRWRLHSVLRATRSLPEGPLFPRPEPPRPGPPRHPHPLARPLPAWRSITVQPHQFEEHGQP